MPGAPIVLLGQGEQYDDPEDWRELMRARRIRRGVELPVRRDGLTTLRRPEDVPELAAVLDAVDPPGPPGEPAEIAPTPSPRPPPAIATAVPPTAERTAPASAPPPSDVGARAPLPTAAPKRRWRFGVWRWVIGIGALLLLRFCAPDGFGPLPGFGGRGGGVRPAAAAQGQSRPAGCERPRGWIAQAACDDSDFARLRPALSRAYAARAAGLDADERGVLAREQARWSAARAACRTAAAPGACLAARYRARIVELGEARAASDAAPDPSPAPPPPPPPGVVALSQPDWVRRPSADELADAFPERAWRLGIGGRARLACRVTEAGTLTACDILSEDPPDYGFGAAALRVSHLFQLRSVGADGRSVEGARVEAPVEFRGG